MLQTAWYVTVGSLHCRAAGRHYTAAALRDANESMQGIVNEHLFQGTAIPWLKTPRSTYLDTLKANLAGWWTWQNVSPLKCIRQHIVSLNYSNSTAAQGIQQHGMMGLIWAQVLAFETHCLSPDHSAFQDHANHTSLRPVHLNVCVCVCVCVLLQYIHYEAEALIRVFMHIT